MSIVQVLFYVEICSNRASLSFGYLIILPVFSECHAHFIDMVQSTAMVDFTRIRCLLGLVSRLLLVVLIALLLLGSSSLLPNDSTNQVRAYTRNIEFDFVDWSLDALRLKLFEAALGTGGYLSVDARHRLVLDYLSLVAEVQQLEEYIDQIYADPNIVNPQLVSSPFSQKLDELNTRRDRIAPVAEAILQSQISYVLGSLGISLGGEPMPPVLYHSTALPLALVVSPRNVIRLDELISLFPDLPVSKRAELEDVVDSNLGVSSLVENIGGIGMYPSMVQQTSNLDWLSEVIAHEWVHNFLTLRPLGINYLTNPELRIMNETTASIAGKEIGHAVLKTFYPELVSSLPSTSSMVETASIKTSTVETDPTSEPPTFEFRKEMHKTRVTVDQMLVEGKVEEAEEYMESRRRVFWEHGFHSLRKINQAYFAFYGAYADEPGGAAGSTEDPVGSAVRALRAQSSSLEIFLNRISWMSSFEQLQQAVEQ